MSMHNIYDDVEFVAHDLETMRKQYERLRYDYQLLHTNLAQAEADRKVLAEEVEAWRKWKSEFHAAALSWTTEELAETRSATDASGALNRAKGTER